MPKYTSGAQRPRSGPGRRVEPLSRTVPTPLWKDELLRDMDAAGVDRAIIVPPLWEGDRNDLAMEVALLHPDRFAVMGRLAIEWSESRSLIDTWTTPGLLGD